MPKDVKKKIKLTICIYQDQMHPEVLAIRGENEQFLRPPKWKLIDTIKREYPI